MGDVSSPRRSAAAEIPEDLESWTAEAMLAYMVERFHPRLYVACSFQKESSVIMDMVLRIEPSTRFFTLDTGLLFPETYATWRELERRYGTEVDVYQGMSLARQADRHGDELWKRSPDRCCGIRKVAPLRAALSGVDAWIAGLRREHSGARGSVPKLQWDATNGRWKSNPLADWSDSDLFRYLSAHGIPYNELHDRGYDSIGCTPCTEPGVGRSGRWAGDDRTECGLHGSGSIRA